MRKQLLISLFLLLLATITQQETFPPDATSQSQTDQSSQDNQCTVTSQTTDNSSADQSNSPSEITPGIEQKTAQTEAVSQWEQNCKSHNDERQCVECYQGYYITTSLPPVCFLYPANCNKVAQSGQCTGCVVGYALSHASQCVVSSSNSTVEVPNCVKYFCHNKCIKCQSGFYLNCEHKCQLLSGNCLMGEMDGECVLCSPGYSLSNGMCHNDNNQTNNQTSSCDLTTCKTSNSILQSCLSCYDHAYVNQQGCCQQVNGFCSQWMQDGRCTACFQGYQINPQNDKECILSQSTNVQGQDAINGN